MGWRRGCSRACTLAVLLLSAAPVAATASPLDLPACAPAEGVYQCSGLTRTWDGVPLDTTVTLPTAAARDLPLVVELHGFGNSKYEYLDPSQTAYTGNAFAWARDGYAVLTYTARGLWGSCGSPDARLADPVACAKGYIHLADVRYEARDAQELAGRLVDEGYAAAGRIGVTGDSYGGGQSLMLAALRDRVMLPDGRLVPWRSPGGRPLAIAAAAPVIPWSDLVSAAAPNGRISPTGVTSRAQATSPVGVEKATFVNAIFAAAQTATGPGQPVGQPFVPGRPMGYLAPPGLDPQADVAGWVTRTNGGEPYTDAQAQAIVDTLARFHSAYYVDPSRPPPPLLLAAGFTDDLFGADEVLRFANRTRRRYPRTPVSLLLGDFGHQRAANKPAERTRLLEDIRGWFDRYLRGGDSGPPPGVVAYAQTCPRSEPSLGPFGAPSFGALGPRRWRFAAAAARTVESTAGDPTVGVALDPVAGGGDSCASTSSSTAPGTAVYTVRPAQATPFTLLGSPYLRARLAVAGTAPGVAQLAARLWDVAPDGTRRLVTRGSYRPHDGANAWWLHAAAWRFAAGHAARLELLGADAPFQRPSNGRFSIDVRDMRLTLPGR
jgi:dienelactone hydrolase